MLTCPVYTPLPASPPALRVPFVVRETPAGAPPTPRLLDRVRAALRARHYSRRTEEASIGWIKRYIFSLLSKLAGIRPGESDMAAYFVWHNRILDAANFQEYLPKALATLTPYHPEVLVLDENSKVIEGSTPWPRTIVVKFDSRDVAMAWYNSPEYQALLPLRLAATEGFGVLVDGFVARKS